jgi:hypothetical protein
MPTCLGIQILVVAMACTRTCECEATTSTLFRKGYRKDLQECQVCHGTPRLRQGAGEAGVVHSSAWSQQQLTFIHAVCKYGMCNSRCGAMVHIYNEHHMLFECRHAMLTATRAEYSELFDEADNVRKLMAAAYKPELATSLGSKVHA